MYTLMSVYTLPTLVIRSTWLCKLFFNQVAEAEAASTWRHVLLFPELFLKIESELIFTIVILQFKTGVKSTLTSQIKELGAINKTDKFEPGLIQVDKNDKHLKWLRWRCGCPRTCGLRGWARCSERFTNEIGNDVFSQELEKWENKAVLNLCLVERKLLKVYNTIINKYNIINHV